MEDYDVNYDDFDGVDFVEMYEKIEPVKEFDGFLFIQNHEFAVELDYV